jgi:hypothetical protein
MKRLLHKIAASHSHLFELARPRLPRRAAEREAQDKRSADGQNEQGVYQHESDGGPRLATRARVNTRTLAL